MRIPSILGLPIVAWLALPAHADLSVNDLPYIQGTPIAEESWEIQDYSQNGEGIHWVWLQQEDSSAYVIYPSEEAALLPDNSVVSASAEQMTLRFMGDVDQELLFTRFGSALFTLIGDEVTVQYTAVAANNADGAYPGNLSMDAREIHMEGELTLDGGMRLDVQGTVGIYGSISIGGNLHIEANSGAILGLVENNGTALDLCDTSYSGTLTSVHIEMPIATKGCSGDFLVIPDGVLEYEPQEVSISTSQSAAQKPQGSKGGTIDWWCFAFFAAIFCRRRAAS